MSWSSASALGATAWLGYPEMLDRRIRPRAIWLKLRDSSPEVAASPAAETLRVRAA